MKCLKYQLLSYYFHLNRPEDGNFKAKAVEKIDTHILSPVTVPENRAICEIMCKSMVEPDRPQVTILCGPCTFHAG
jgi:hypothetical protein